jgi:hypothetical protein
MTTLLKAEIAWPSISEDHTQLDWIDHMFAVDAWLNTNVGREGRAWRWRDAPGGGLAVQFERPQDLAWFMLKWA